MDPRPRVWPVAVAWLATRALLFGLWFLIGGVHGDVVYYWTRMASLFGHQLAPTELLVEYPTPVIWVLAIPYALSGHTQSGFIAAFVILMLAIDLLFTVLLWQGGRGRRAVWFWVWFVLLMGPITYMRLDLLPSVLCGAALLAMRRRRDGMAGGLLAVGTGLKLWPLMLWPASLRGARRRDVVLTVSFWVTGVVLAVASILYASWDRLLTPVSWQSGRGLQIESVWATPAMIARALFPGSYTVAISKWQAYEVSGAIVPFWLSVAGLSTSFGYLVIVIAYVWWVRQRYPRLLSLRPSLDGARPAPLTSVALFMMVIVVITLITNKTFSPQYVMWLAAPTASLLVLVGDDGVSEATRLTARKARTGVLILTGGTQLVYPLLYNPLVHGHPFLGFATVVLALRNLFLIALGAWLIRAFWPVLRWGSPDREDDHVDA